MKLQEEGRFFQIVLLQVLIDDLEAEFVKQFEPGYRKSAGHNLVGSLSRLLQSWEKDAHCMDENWNRMQPQNEARNNTKRSTRSDEKILEVIAATGLAYRAAQSQNLSICQHHLEFCDVLPHATITYRCSATGI